MKPSVLLETNDVTIRFGGVVAVDQVSVQVKAGQIFGLIGPNGAGKTTMFNLLTGVYKPTSGKILFKGKDITSLKAYEITQHGISRTFQNIRLLNGHTVFENVLLAAHSKLTYRFSSAFFQSKHFRMQESEAQRTIHELLQAFDLFQLRDAIATDLPQGLQRKIEIVRALTTGAEMLFLDEPAAGLNPVETDEMMDMIRELKKRGKTIFLIEHDMKLVKGLCDEIAVLHFGKLLDQGTYQKVTGNPQVIQAYLGRRYESAQSK